MNKTLFSVLVICLVAGIIYRLDLYSESMKLEKEMVSLRSVPRTKITERASRIRQLHEEIDNHRMYVPSGSDDAHISSYSTRLQFYADVMTAETVRRAINTILSEKREGAHQYGVALYRSVLDKIKANNTVIKKHSDIAQLYKDAIWLARCHGHGLSQGVSVNEVQQMFDDGQKYCWNYIKEEASWFTFERALFLSKYTDHDRSLLALENGIKYLGHNNDRDGSVLHEYGMALMRKSHRDKNVELLQVAINQFDKAIIMKSKSGNTVTPLYSRKMRCEALAEYYFTKNMKNEFLALKDDYIQLAKDWEDSLLKFDNGGLKALPEIYLACAYCLVCNQDKETAVSFLKKYKEALQKYDSSNSEALDNANIMLREYETNTYIR